MLNKDNRVIQVRLWWVWNNLRLQEASRLCWLTCPTFAYMNTRPVWFHTASLCSDPSKRHSAVSSLLYIILQYINRLIRSSV